VLLDREVPAPAPKAKAKARGKVGARSGA